MSRWLLVLVTGCGGASSVPSQIAVPAEGTILLTDTALGALKPTTRGNLGELRRVLLGYDVVPVNLDTTEEFPALEYQVFEGDKRLFEIVPDPDGNILNVHVDSPKVTVMGQTWRVGAPFAGTITTCACWGGKPVCFKKGAHVAVSFARKCGGLTTAKGRRALDGKPIARLVWSPKPLGEETGGDDYGGAEAPTVFDDPLGP